MIVVTGGAGFIGSNIVAALNAAGHDDIVVVDDLSDGTKFVNIADLAISDYADKDAFLARILAGENPGPVSAIFHQGACSDTTEWDGRLMLDTNYEYSKHLLHFSLAHGIPFLYASSASVYGDPTKNRSTCTPGRRRCSTATCAAYCRTSKARWWG